MEVEGTWVHWTGIVPYVREDTEVAHLRFEWIQAFVP